MDIPEDLASGAQPLLGSPWQTDDVSSQTSVRSFGDNALLLLFPLTWWFSPH